MVLIYGLTIECKVSDDLLKKSKVDDNKTLKILKRQSHTHAKNMGDFIADCIVEIISHEIT